MSQEGTDDRKDPAGDGHTRGARRGAYRLLWNNFITMVGLFLAATGIILLLTFGLFALVTDYANAYSGVGGYLIAPFILVVGVLLTPLGILFKSWRLHRRDASQPLAFRFPRVDLTDPVQRRAGKIVVLALFVLMPVIAVAGYRGYSYTESHAFCTKVCHSVMLPQSVTHDQSAHAQVACARCHVGENTTWFVKSKLSGFPQILAVLWDDFPRPIPPAITELRPTRDTCVQCHWPKKAFGVQLKKIERFASDESNTRRKIDVLLKIGGYEPSGETEGIHAHMALAKRIEYVATDAGLQQIPWVKYTDENGKQIVFRSDGKPDTAPKPEGRLRQFDCMDCHNRPAHKFRSPQESVDLYLSTGRIDSSIPFIKRESVAALAKTYPDEQTAEAEIEAAITSFYRTNYADQWTQLDGSVGQAVDAVRKMRRSNFFSNMNVTWQSYPDNIGHTISPGCFRCHDGKHVSQDGEQIRFACDLCHVFITPADKADNSLVYAGTFEHSFKLEGAHAVLRCDECHDGGISPLLTCARCHEDDPTH